MPRGDTFGRDDIDREVNTDDEQDHEPSTHHCTLPGSPVGLRQSIPSHLPVTNRQFARMVKREKQSAGQRSQHCKKAAFFSKRRLFARHAERHVLKCLVFTRGTYSTNCDSKKGIEPAHTTDTQRTTRTRQVRPVSRDGHQGRQCPPDARRDLVARLLLLHGLSAPPPVCLARAVQDAPPPHTLQPLLLTTDILPPCVTGCRLRNVHQASSLRG